jgi:hypothetical protein
MRLKQLHEGLPKKTSRPMNKVWQDEERQGKRHKRWYAPRTVGPDAGTYRWGTGKPMGGDGYEEHILD